MWPEVLTQTALNLGTLRVKREADRTEISSSGAISIECNWNELELTSDEIESILARVPSQSSVHLVIMQRIPNVRHPEDLLWKKNVMEMLEGLKHQHSAQVFALAEDVVVMSSTNEYCAVECSKCNPDKLILFLQVVNMMPQEVIDRARRWQ